MIKKAGYGQTLYRLQLLSATESRCGAARKYRLTPACPAPIGTVEPVSGGCIYCNARGSGTGAFAQGVSVAEQIVRSKALMAKRYKATKYIAYFQSFSNTYAPVSILKQCYDAALTVPDVVGLAIGTVRTVWTRKFSIFLKVMRNSIWYGLNTVFSPHTIQPCIGLTAGMTLTVFKKPYPRPATGESISVPI